MVTEGRKYCGRYESKYYPSYSAYRRLCERTKRSGANGRNVKSMRWQATLDATMLLFPVIRGQFISVAFQSWQTIQVVARSVSSAEFMLEVLRQPSVRHASTRMRSGLLGSSGFSGSAVSFQLSGRAIRKKRKKVSSESVRQKKLASRWQWLFCQHNYYIWNSLMIMRNLQSHLAATLLYCSHYY